MGVFTTAFRFCFYGAGKDHGVPGNGLSWKAIGIGVFVFLFCFFLTVCGFLLLLLLFLGTAGWVFLPGWRNEYIVQNYVGCLLFGYHFFVVNGEYLTCWMAFWIRDINI